MKAAITGADGFVGTWLARHLQEMGDPTWRLVGPAADGVAREPGLSVLDVTEARPVAAAMQDIRPDVIFHLAAISHGPGTAQEPDLALRITLGGTLHVLSAAAQVRPHPIVVIPSSAAVYGNGRRKGPIRETSSLRPSSLYGAMKVAQEAFAEAFAAGDGVPVVVARLFNQIGPGQSPAFAIPSFARQLASIAFGDEPAVVHVGDLRPRRDFTDVRDGVRALRLLAIRGRPGTFNVASGTAHSIGSLLAQLIELSDLHVDVQTTPERSRRGEASIIIGSADRLRKATGWHPRIPLTQSMRDVWEDACGRYPRVSQP